MDVIGFVEASTVIFRQLPTFQGDWLWLYLWCNIVFSFLKLSPQITQMNGFRSQRFAIPSHLKEKNINTVVTSFNNGNQNTYWLYLTKDTLFVTRPKSGGKAVNTVLFIVNPVHDPVTNK